MMRIVQWIFLLSCMWMLGMGCASPEQDAPPPATQEKLFSLLPPARTHIDFANTLSEHPSPQRNRLLYEYFSNGGGVAVGDLNGDGLDDVYFTGNMRYNALYLNRGRMTFEDITSVAGVAGRQNTWKTGVTMADINGDGRLDLYVCYSGDLPLDRRVDELYINLGNDANGAPRFEERAAAYGLANPHSSNQGYFFDYDRDGDLDLFLLTHNVKNTPLLDEAGARAEQEKEDPISGVRFYRNEGERFEDVTRAAGLSSSSLTYGLGAGIGDIDNDGWIDIYIGNDYSPPDYLYMNNGDGTFTDELGDRMGHTSNASMGVDVADINNDGWQDVVVLDMLAESHRRQKTLFIPNDRSVFQTIVRSGFHRQYMRNTLQLNNGNGTFSEIGWLAGIAMTDWSWTPLIADFDNDGRKDLFVTNGNLYDTLDRDFLAFKNNYVASKRQQLNPADIAYLMEMLPPVDMRNYAFRNTGDLRFEDASSRWGLDEPLKSAGAAYADLDNDGDLDLIVNNINGPASVFENHATDEPEHAYLQIDLVGEGSNTSGLGAKVTLYAGGVKQYLEQMPARGYLSSVATTLHFGLGGQTRVDSIQVIWPDGKRQVIEGIEANRRITIRQSDAAVGGLSIPHNIPVFAETPSPIAFEHRMAGDIDDFRRQPLMDHPQSFSGPPLAKADVNGDGLDDVFVGGGSGQSARLFLQRTDGRFTPIPVAAFEADARSHDVDAEFFDYDGDGDPDLYVASGGYGAFAPDDPAFQDRLYVNNGAGTFIGSPDALPEMHTSTGAVDANDIDGDGRPDLFVGGRVVSGRYPETPRSYVLMSDGAGHFLDRTDEIAPALQRPGMVTDAAWSDLDGDGMNELVVVGAWMPISVFEYEGGMLTNRTDTYFDASYSGLWNTILVEDLNNDGRPDLLAGNLGLNSRLMADEAQPAELFYADFNNDGSVDPLLTFFLQGASYPDATLDELRVQLPAIASRFPGYAAYAEAKIGDLFTDGRLAEARKLEANYLETSLFIGGEDGRFVKSTLPIEAQFSPVFTARTLDYDGDGSTDLLLAGNIDEGNIRFGRYDASYGMLFRGDGKASFEYVPQYLSGLRLRGAVRSAIEINGNYLFGVNRSTLRAYRIAEER